MVKKSVKSVKTAEVIKNKPKIKSSKQDKFKIQEALIDNFVSMQKVLANLAVKFDSLAEQISKLLQLFEISAKSFVEKQHEVGGEDKDFIEKLNTLLDQNKTIARGLTLLEQKMRERHSPQPSMFPASSPTQPQLRKIPAPTPKPWPPSSSYQQSVTSEEQETEEEKLKPKPLPII